MLIWFEALAKFSWHRLLDNQIFPLFVLLRFSHRNGLTFSVDSGVKFSHSQAGLIKDGNQFCWITNTLNGMTNFRTKMG